VSRLRIDSIAQLPPALRAQAERQLAAKHQPAGASKAPKVFRRCSHVACRKAELCVQPMVYELVLPGRALTTNRYLSALFVRNPEARAARTAEVGRTYRQWKEAAYALAIHERIPTLGTAVFEAQAIYTSRLPDAGGLAIVGKACLDGLVEAGVLPDDDGRHVLGEWYPAPRQDSAGDRVQLTLRANLPSSEHIH